MTDTSTHTEHRDFDQMCDAIGDNTGLPATGTGEDEQRTLTGFDSFTLLRIELVEEGQPWNSS